MVVPEFATGPAWPPDIRTYENLMSLSYPQFAWEALRRNPDYVGAVRRSGSVRTWRLAGAPNVLMSRDRAVCHQAHRFALCSFRRA